MFIYNTVMGYLYLASEWVLSHIDFPFWIAKIVLYGAFLGLAKLASLPLKRWLRADFFPPLLALSGVALGIGDILTVVRQAMSNFGASDFGWMLHAFFSYTLGAGLALVLYYVYFRHKGLSIRQEYDTHKVSYIVTAFFTAAFFFVSAAVSFFWNSFAAGGTSAASAATVLTWALELFPIGLTAVVCLLYFWEERKAVSNRIPPRLVYDNSRNSLLGKGSRL